jgi:hypothetical protein
MALLLCDLIKLAGIELGKFKVHLATGERNPNPPLAAYFDGKFEEWQEYQNQRNFQCEHVIGLIHLGGPRWLFAGVWKVLGVRPRKDGAEEWFEYDTVEVKGLEHLAGRAVIQYSRTGRNSYRHGDPLAGELVVGQLLEERMRMADFSSYASVLLSFDQLRHVVRRALPSWRAALGSVAGVYLIADTSCGKHYVGSACGAEGIWGRWGAYAESGHGGNAELAALLREMGADHAKHFLFSILEICDLRDTAEAVIAREGHWKSALLSREFGYNAN